MRSIANRNSRRGMRLPGAFCGVAAAMFLIAAVTVLPAQAAATSTTEIQNLAVHPGSGGAQLEVASDGTLVWTTYRDADGRLVIELPNSMPADSVIDLWPDDGLLEAVEVTTENGGDRPLTRLTIRTRGATEHSIQASGPALLVDFTAIGEVAERTWDEPLAEETLPTAPSAPEVSTAGTPFDAIQGPVGEPIGVAATQLEGIEVSSHDGETVVRIVGDGGFYFSSFNLDAPDRFVVDLLGVANRAPSPSIMVENHTVERVRIAQFKEQPDMVSRVVVDLRDASETRVEQIPNGLELRFASTAVATMELEESPVIEEAPQVAALEPAPVEPEPVAVVEPIVEPEPEGMGADENGTVGAHELSTPPVALPVEIQPEPITPEPVAFEPEPEVVEPIVAVTPEPEYQIADASLTREPEPSFVSSSYQDEVAEGGAAPQAQAAQSFSSQTVSGDSPTYTGAPMSISLKDGDIKDVLRSFAQISGLNIVVQPGVTGTVTVELTDVPWDQALEEILKINGLGYVLEGNIMRVAPVKVLADEASERQRLRQANALSVPLKTIMKRVSYAEASTMAGILMSGGGASLVSQRGSVVVDSRTNTLIIKELPDYIDTVLAVIETLDVPEPQVMIEARIIETTKRFNRTVGIQWGFNGISSPAYGNTTGLQFPNQGSVDGSVNLLTGGSNGLLDISLGNVLGTFSIDATLQAAEDEGLINILSAPKVATLNNEQASIQSGLQIPIQTVANNTVSVQFVNATLRLDVTPHVTAEGTVLMDINIQKREPLLAFTVVGATNAPISTKDARTRVIVRDGGTTVIGGIYKVTSDQGEDRVPGLANIPVLGHLFKNKRRSDENEELLIFITPRVIKL
jgi:type IV pilus assembly protein PilQ